MLSIRTLGLLRLILLFSDSGSECPPDHNQLTLNPAVIIKEYGEPITVNCTNINKDHDGIYWKIGNVSTEEEYNSFVVLSLPKLDWNTEAQCRIMLGETIECSKDLDITLYKKPNVTVRPVSNDNPLEGKLYELQCVINDVAPIQNLTVTWYRNNQTISTHHFNKTTKTPESEASHQTLNISREDDGAEFTCEAWLDLGPEGPQPPVKSNATQTLSVHYPPEFKTKTNVNVTFVNKSSDISLNCEAEGNPPPQYSWTEDGVNLSASTEYLNLTQVNESTTYFCTATNNLRSIVKQFHVIVTETATTPAPGVMTNPQAFVPRDCPLTITPPEIVVRYGDPVSVNCSTTSTDVMGIGWEGAGTENVSDVTWTVAKLEDWNINPACFATLKDNSQCKKIPNFTLYKTPDIVSVLALNTSGPVVQGQEFQLICNIINVAPVDSLKVIWRKNNKVVWMEMFSDTSVTPKNVSSILKMTAGMYDNGAHFTCAAELHLGENGPQPVPAETSEPYTAVVYYKPLFSSCPPAYTGKEHGFSMDMVPCEADANPPAVVQWYYHETPINVSEPLTRNHSGKYRAEAVNRVGKSSAFVDVTVEYGPSFSCNGYYEVEENDNFHSKCQPEGIPKPDTVWFQGGKQMASPQSWKRQDSGKYSIVATNKHGKANHNLYLDVLYAPKFKEGNYSKEMISGETITLDCYAEGNPSPLVQWYHPPTAVNVKTTGGQQRSIIVVGAKSTSVGVYNCRATNKVGSVTRTVTLIMKGETSALPKSLIILLLILVSIVFVVIFIAVLHKCNKNRRQYTFVSDSDTLPMSQRSNGM